MADRTGQLLGNYRLIRLLGQGGFADVYLGEHIHLNTLAAIKLLRAQIVEEEAENFRTEARTIAHLVHPNIVRVLDFGVDGNTPFLVMEYAPNGTLRVRHPRGVPVALDVVVSHVQQVAAALQYAHDQKLIHRDIKPENMLLGRNNEVLLSDFGIAVVTQSARAQSMQNQQSWDPAGTAAYMAPEQIQGKTVPASDQYGLAIVVYEWLTGRAPFNGTYMEVVSQQVSTTPPSLREKDPAIPPDVEHVVMTALAKDPLRRFGRIQVFAKALEQAAQANAPVPVPAMPSIQSSSTSSSQNKPTEALTMEASLTGLQGRIVLGPSKLTIGRAADNNLVIKDGKVSSHHAELRPDGQFYSIVDLGSTNKTLVNEQLLISGVPRQLQQGDKLRFGDTTFTYEVRDALQNKAAAPNEPTIFAAPGEAPPNFGGGNTSYGGGGAQQEYLETLPSQQPLYMPPQIPPQAPSYTPPPSAPLYTPPNQQSSYEYPMQPQPYGGMGQQPIYTPPHYTQPQPQQLPPAKKRSPLLIILLAVLALVIILGGVGVFAVINNNNVNTQHANATATTNANNNVAATVHTIATQNAVATQAASATAQVTSHYPPFTTLAFNDKLTSSDSQWNTGSSCQFTAAGYQASIAQLGFIQGCIAQTAKFGDFAYQVNMTINSGDCGGLEFRHVDSNNFYILLICSNGTYNFGVFINNKVSWVHAFSQMLSSSAIHQGANQQNVIAVSVQGSAFNLYVNGSSKPVDVFTDSGGTFSQGAVGLLALDNVNPTSVTYTNAVVWTA
jgi:serine/threonine protein kinase